MDDSKTITISVGTQDPVILDHEKKNLAFTIRCKENTTDVIFRTGYSFNPVLGLYHEHPIRIRIDDQKAEEKLWRESTDGKALFARRPIQLLKRLNKAETLKIQFTPYNSSSRIATFKLSGIDQHLPEIAETCNWKLYS